MAERRDERHLTSRRREPMIGGMETRQRERTYQELRAAHLARLTDHGVAELTAEKVVSAWEREATARGRDPGSEAFWDGAEDWIVAHRQR